MQTFHIFFKEKYFFSCAQDKPLTARLLVRMLSQSASQVAALSWAFHFGKTPTPHLFTKKKHCFTYVIDIPTEDDANALMRAMHDFSDDWFDMMRRWGCAFDPEKHRGLDTRVVAASLGMSATDVPVMAAVAVIRAPQFEISVHQLNGPRTICHRCLRGDGPMKRCASCNGPHYCSKKCQQVDWPFHKALCKALRQAQLESSAGPSGTQMGGAAGPSGSGGS